MSNPYYNELFNTMDELVSLGGKIGDGSKLKVIADTTPELSVFEPSTASASSIINIAGNYKYSCIVPIGEQYPPNYVGVLQENKALADGDNLIHELLTFTNANDQTYNINCNSLVAKTYEKIFKNGANDSDTYMINFTNGLPYSFFEPGLRGIHRDVTKRINKLIDHAIRTGQDKDTDVYSTGLVKLFHEIFFKLSDESGKEYENAVPRYYALRTGILPTAVSYAKWLAAKANDEAESLADHADDYLAEVDQLTKGYMFIPGGISDQFGTSSNKQQNQIYWYPFNVNKQYSYRFNYGDSNADKHQTTDDQDYVVEYGFNHCDVNKETNGTLWELLFKEVPADTDTLNDIFTTDDNLKISPMILSYESSLSTVPAPGTVTIVPTVPRYIENNKTTDCLKKGIRSTIVGIVNGSDVNIWANPINNSTATMHPLLNRDGKNKNYLDITTEEHPSYINDDTFAQGNDQEEDYYYNYKFSFNPEKRAVDRLNYYSKSKNANENRCNAYNLEFAKISNQIFTMSDKGTLQIDPNDTIDSSAFGVISKRESNAWKTRTLGICNVKRVDLTSADHLNAYDDNGLFTMTEETVPTVNMPIRALHYMDPVEPPKGKWTEGMSCPYRDDDVQFLGSVFGNCRKVPYLRHGTKFDPMEWDRDRKDIAPGWKDFETFNTTVSIDRSTAQIGQYNKQNLHSICKTVLEGNVAEYYYTIHILADDGDVNNILTVNTGTGSPEFNSNGTVKNNSSDSYNLKAHYGTGLQYFFAGVCNKNIYEQYYNKGLTVQQLLDYESGIDEGSNTDTKTGKRKIRLSRVSGGLRRAYLTFEWDYDLILEAWQIALWIMRGEPHNDKQANNGDDFDFWKADKAPIALAAFFDYIYASNKQSKLLVGPSLKQINNIIGPYGSEYATKGISSYTKEATNIEDTTLNTIKGKVWDDISNHRNAVRSETTTESGNLKYLRNNKLKWNQDELVYGNRYINSATDHTLVSAHIFADKDLNTFTTTNGNIKSIGPLMRRNGVGKNYWGKGEYAGYESPWGKHKTATNSTTFTYWYGNLQLDHYSWDWNIDHENKNVSPTSDAEQWKGAFMIHASDDNGNIRDDGGKFNWHLGPFHTVSEEGQRHTNEYGVRKGKSKWTQWDADTGHTDKNHNCRAGLGYENPNRMAWHGINGQTNGNQNPNIRVRLPMLWRYLKALRAERIYTDGQLMPCGVELHYNEAAKALVTSIKDTELSIPLYVNDSRGTADAWIEAIKNPSATVFAEVLRDTYAISTATIAKWKNIIFNKDNTTRMIKDILATVAKQKPKIVAMNRAKIYVDSLSDNNISLQNGKTVFNLPVLPIVASFGTKIPGESKHMDTSITDTEDPLTTIGSKLPNYYRQCPSVDFGAVVPVNRIGIGVTDTPQLNDDSEPNQFTAISNALYNDVLGFDGNTFGWLVPIPHASNLALLNAYDDTWRKEQPSVIPLRLNDNEYKTRIRTLEDKSLHWIGWFVADYRDKLEENDIKSSIHFCDDGSNLEDNAVVRAAILRITPYMQPTPPEDTADAEKQQNVSEPKPFAVKLEIDTRSEGGVNLIMIHDTIQPTDTVKVEYEINNIALNVKLPNTTHTVVSNITNVSYDRVMYAAGAIEPL